MGIAYIQVGEPLRQRLYDHPAKHGVQVIDDHPWDNVGTRLLRVLSDKLSPGENGMQEIVCEDDGEGFWFKKYDAGYES